MFPTVINKIYHIKIYFYECTNVTNKIYHIRRYNISYTIKYPKKHNIVYNNILKTLNDIFIVKGLKYVVLNIFNQIIIHQIISQLIA